MVKRPLTVPLRWHRRSFTTRSLPPESTGSRMGGFGPATRSRETHMSCGDFVRLVWQFEYRVLSTNDARVAGVRYDDVEVASPRIGTTQESVSD